MISSRSHKPVSLIKIQSVISISSHYEVDRRLDLTDFHRGKFIGLDFVSLQGEHIKKVG
jgi:hypothetical protein